MIPIITQEHPIYKLIQILAKQAVKKLNTEKHTNNQSEPPHE